MNDDTELPTLGETQARLENVINKKKTKQSVTLRNKGKSKQKDDDDDYNNNVNNINNIINEENDDDLQIIENDDVQIIEDDIL